MPYKLKKKHSPTTSEWVLEHDTEVATGVNRKELNAAINWEVSKDGIGIILHTHY